MCVVITYTTYLLQGRLCIIKRRHHMLFLSLRYRVFAHHHPSINDMRGTSWIGAPAWICLLRQLYSRLSVCQSETRQRGFQNLSNKEYKIAKRTPVPVTIISSLTQTSHRYRPHGLSSLLASSGSSGMDPKTPAGAPCLLSLGGREQCTTRSPSLPSRYTRGITRRRSTSTRTGHPVSRGCGSITCW